jgi:hypothetical protein
MKRLLIIPFLLSFYFVQAGTGSGRDSLLFYIAIIAVLSIILAVLFSITLVRKIIAERKKKKLSHLSEQAHLDPPLC